MEIMSDDAIGTLAEQWAKNHLGKNFQFREYQLNTIIQIIKYKLTGVKTQVMEAPCGSGKSTIAFIVCGVLWEYFGLKSYILVSDLSLFDQYEQDLKKYNLNWGRLKGKDNYICARNGQVFTNGECQIKGIGMPTLSDPQASKSKGFSCGPTCKYVIERRRAENSPITIMTYQFWFIAMNYVKDICFAGCEDMAPFQKRDFIICDEAHKIPDLVQRHFSPRIDSDDIGFLFSLREIAEKLDYGQDLPAIDSFKQVMKAFTLVEEPKDIMLCIKRYENLLGKYNEFQYWLRDVLSKKGSVERYLKYLNAGNTCRECHCKFSDFISLIEELGLDTIVLSASQDKSENYHISINCAFEHKMVKKYLHDKAPQELLMSATIGDCDIYKSMIGEEELDNLDFKAFTVPSTFDFSKSPIYFYPKFRLSYNEKAKNLPLVINEIINILNKHTNEKGIIQTGSYEFSKALYDNLTPTLRSRVLFYKDSKEKNEVITKYKNSINKILIGPSLIEGINFPNDECRFLIMMKVPYASLGDKLVQRKMNIIPGYYHNDVCQKITQGIGRIQRSKNDWGITYIMDGCFKDILRNNKNDLPTQLLDRIIEV